MRCADVSFLDELELAGAVYSEGGSPSGALEILRNQGLDAVRLRLFHSPDVLRDGLDDMLQLAQRARALDMHLVLALHLSDTWADPGHQQKPAAWETLPFAALEDSVRAYVERVMVALEAQGTTPAVVQIGNEITTGMLWDDGRVGGPFDTDVQWQRLGRLLKAGVEGVRAAAGDEVIVMIHIDRGGSPTGARWFFDRLTAEGVPFEWIGLSYYPWWHGPLDQFEATLDLVSRRYEKPVFLAETAYPWTLQWFDNRNNIVGLAEHVLPGYPATPDGQARFLARIGTALDAVQATGVCYWEPAYIAAPDFGSPWENLALFDETGEVLPGAATLGGLRRTDRSTEAEPARTVTVFPSPATDAISVELPHSEGCVDMAVYNTLGQQLKRIQIGCKPGGPAVRIPISDLARGVYAFALSDERRGWTVRGTFVVAM